MPTSSHTNAFMTHVSDLSIVRTEYLEATLGLVKHLEISKECVCVTVPGCCCCMPLLHNHLMDSSSYACKNTLLAAKGGCKCTPLTPPYFGHYSLMSFTLLKAFLNLILLVKWLLSVTQANDTSTHTQTHT